VSGYPSVDNFPTADSCRHRTVLSAGSPPDSRTGVGRFKAPAKPGTVARSASLNSVEQPSSVLFCNDSFARSCVDTLGYADTGGADRGVDNHARR